MSVQEQPTATSLHSYQHFFTTIASVNEFLSTQLTADSCSLQTFWQFAHLQFLFFFCVFQNLVANTEPPLPGRFLKVKIFSRQRGVLFFSYVVIR